MELPGEHLAVCGRIVQAGEDELRPDAAPAKEPEQVGQEGHVLPIADDLRRITVAGLEGVRQGAAQIGPLRPGSRSEDLKGRTVLPPELVPSGKRTTRLPARSAP